MRELEAPPGPDEFCLPALKQCCRKVDYFFILWVDLYIVLPVIRELPSRERDESLQSRMSAKPTGWKQSGWQ